MQERHFRFSVIMPVYNVEKYLDEAVESLIAQTIGFESNIQLILVNDGSTDGSGDLCKSYSEKYPNNIIYVEKENGGLSSARNAGIPYATGDYINFIDPDDKWEHDALSHVDDYFRNNPDIMFATCRLKFFGAVSNKAHHLDYTFKQTRTADVTQNYMLTTLSASKAFYRRDIFDDRRFDETVRYAEDVLFVNKLLLEIEKYGLIREAVYWYRKREDKTSLLDISTTDPEYYKTPDRVYQPLIESSISKFGEVIPYIQYLLITDLQWKIKEIPPKVLDKNEEAAYVQRLKEIILRVEDKYILKQRNMNASAKAYAFRLKYGDDETETPWKHKLAGTLKCIATILDVRGGKLVIQGRGFEKSIGDDYRIEVRDNNGKIWQTDYKPYPIYDTFGVDKNMKLMGYEHIISLPLTNRASYKFYISDGEGWSKRIDIKTGKFSRLTEYEDSFFAGEGYIIKRFADRIKIYDYKLRTFIASMHRYNKKLKEKYGASEDIISNRRAVVRYRLLHKKPLWLLSDRSHLARDNASALFKYLMSSEAKSKYDICFLLEKESSDLDRMRKLGRVIEMGSEEHIILQTAADLIISSHADNWVINPYEGNLKYYRDLISFNYVFLQHGIIKDDLSRWLHKYSKNISMFVTTTKPETESVINGNYGYDDSVVKMTGLARYDDRIASNEKLIIYAPTWRKSLGGSVGKYRRIYNTDFALSDYCKFYNKLINDERILECMKRNHYRGEFFIHPALETQAKDFDGNDVIAVLNGETDYEEAINKGAALITDYSSLAFDFAYLNKPVVYSQFDVDEIYNDHIYDSGYYSYENDGFGPVCYDYETSVSAIIDLIEKDCEQPDEYAKRVGSTFSYTDTKNCERIYKELERLQGQNECAKHNRTPLQ